MIIGFSGCQRSGKTYAAQKLADMLGYEFVPTNVSSVLQKHPNASKSFKNRMNCQNDILGHLAGIIDQCKGKNVVLDRTPIDMIVYTMDAYTWREANDANEKILEKYLSACSDLMSKIDFTVKTDLLDIVVDAENKAPTGFFYRLKLDSMFDSMYTYDYQLAGGSYESRDLAIENMISKLKEC